MKPRSFHFWSVSIVLWGTFVASAAPADRVDFKRDIQPLLESRCTECHGDKKQKSGLRLDRKESVWQGGDSGKPALLPGRSADSPILQHILSPDPAERMPPKGDRLTASQIDLLRNWIDQGASWPETATEQKHWAYVKPVRSPLPQVRNPQWPRNAIDYFVLARLEAAKLKPSPEAERAVLLRRVSLDLTGLPPTLEELDAFLADKSPQAWERVVDRLLASPAYGERWARPWLDLARYADTQGYEKDNRRTMWPYRDWVINALNRNLPFDQFTLEQIAGDLLPDATQDQKVATGFHRNTMTNTEGGTDNEEFRYEAVVDRLNTTFAVWMGTTLSCAQCHNHKYDPFLTREYYQAMAFLNSTTDADADDERPTMKVFPPDARERLQKLRDAEKAAEREWNDAASTPAFAQALEVWENKMARAQTAWETLSPLEFRSQGGATLKTNNTRSLLAEGNNPTNDTYVVTTSIDAGRWTGFRLEALETGTEKALGRHANGGFVLRRFELTTQVAGTDTGGQPVPWKSVTADFSQKGFDVTSILTGKEDGWAVATFEEKNKVRRSAYFSLSTPLDLPAGSLLTFTLGHSDKHPGANLRRFRLYATQSDEVGLPTPLPDDIRNILAVASAQRDEKQRAKLRDYYKSSATDLKPQRDALAAAKKAADDFEKTIPIASVMVELPKPRETHRHVRGAYLTKAEAVVPGTPAALHPFRRDWPTNRLGFAQWLTDTNNPLTARVMVNRIWEQYFGRGIVETVEEFGKQGEPPSHPELLDWLATEFMRVGWDLKALHKTIVLSATYRQSSKVPPDLLQRDPNNHLFARGPRVRLEAEMLRDQMLTVSGLLSHKMGGPSVMPPQPDGVWQVVYSGDKWETSKGEDKYRRGLYTFWRRTAPHPAMVSFDAPSREFCVLRRNRSDTPLQALTTLNDPAAIEAAQALARRVASQKQADVRAKATYAFRLVLARRPQGRELERLVNLFESERAHYRHQEKAAEKMANAEASKLSNPADLAERAAWTVVANVLLNLDEAITKG